MHLHSVHIREFKSVRDSTLFEVGQTTCLVGKNEAGKTAILQALYRLNPIVEADAVFDVTFDYPKMDVEDYRQDVEAGRRAHATVVRAVFKLEAHEVDVVEEQLGKGILPKNEVALSRGYDTDGAGRSRLAYSLEVDEAVAVRHFVSELPPESRVDAVTSKTVENLCGLLEKLAAENRRRVAEATAAANALQDEAQKATALEKARLLDEAEETGKLRVRLGELKDVKAHIWNGILRQMVPKFLYFDEYYQLEGRANVPALKERERAGKLKPSDRPLLGLIDLARLNLDAILGMTADRRVEEQSSEREQSLDQEDSEVLVAEQASEDGIRCSRRSAGRPRWHGQRLQRMG